MTCHPGSREPGSSNFEAFWQPFTLGAGPAPGYCVNLTEDHRAALKGVSPARPQRMDPFA